VSEAEPVPAGPRTVRPGRRTWDVVLAVALLVLLAVVAIVLGVAGAFLVMASDGCGVRACREVPLTLGVFVAMIGPAVVLVVAVVSVVERLVRRRLAFWPPLVGIGVAVLVWLGGTLLVFGAVPSS
jgi:uncharacterized BrkB/YihY/UPF0761 family membrane protein